MAASRNEHVRFRYGICLNEQCSKCKSKEVQEIPARKELVCAECGKPLRECPRPLTWWEKNGKKAIGGVVAVAVIGVGGLWGSGLLGGSDKTAPEQNAGQPEQNTVQVDTTKQKQAETPVDTTVTKLQTVVEEDKKDIESKDDTKQPSKPATESQKIANGRGTINFPYGTYSGDIRNGKPDGAGVMTYSKAHKVVSTKDVVAQPGERFDGVFENGKATFGTLYQKDGNVIKIKR